MVSSMLITVKNLKWINEAATRASGGFCLYEILAITALIDRTDTHQL